MKMGKKDIALLVASAVAMIVYLYTTDHYPQVRSLTQK